MVEFELEQLFPRFLLMDKNGYAMAKAIEAAMRCMCKIVRDGVNLIVDYDSMPEWRLDELAWEFNCPYDYKGSIEQKRRWIKESAPAYAIHGTKAAIIKYLIGAFESVEVEEGSEYYADPFHFRVMVSGELTAEKEEWLRKAVNLVKNVRSVLDEFATGSHGKIAVHGTGKEIARIAFPLCGDCTCGTWPEMAE
ncbi:MAG: hypothetical protein J6B91_09395 [Prevotella sp.]|nr:hypothetical protein [Prevotella sp.]